MRNSKWWPMIRNSLIVLWAVIIVVVTCLGVWASVKQ